MMKARAPAVLSILVVTILPMVATPAESDLKVRLQKAPGVKTEDLCQPVKSVRDGMLLWAPNPDGETWDLLQIYFPQYGGPNTIVVIDLGSGQVKQIQTDRGWNFHLCPSVVAPNGKLFISALDGRLRQKICTYDPSSNEFVLDAVKMPPEILGETHPLVLGTDGKLFAIGQHPIKAAAAVEIDPETLAAKLVGLIGPSHSPNACWGYSGGADDRFIYVASGKVPWYLVAFDRQKGTSKTLAETQTFGGMVSVSQRHDGCTGSATGLVGGGDARVDYWLYEGKAIAKKSRDELPPWPARNPPRTSAPRPEVNTELVVPDTDGFAEIWVRNRKPQGPAPADATPESLGWKRFRYQVPIYPHSIYRLVELPDGRLFGTAGAYEGNFIFDPKTNQASHLGKIHLSHYATAFHDGKIYMSGYPTSPLYVYDSAKPWTAGKIVNNRFVQDQDEAANPRQLLLLGKKELAGTHKMYGAATGADGKVYFGGTWIRDGACGGLAWYDPATGKAGGFWKPLSNYQVTHLAATDHGRMIVLSTKRVDDPILKKPKPDQGALLFFDTATGQLSEPFDPVMRAKATGPIVAVGESRVLGWTEDPDIKGQSILYLVDVRGPKLVFVKPLPIPFPVGLGSNQQEAWDFRAGPDGRVWTFGGASLVRIDPADGAVEVVGFVSPGPIAFAGKDVYLGGSVSVRRLTGLVTSPR